MNIHMCVFCVCIYSKHNCMLFYMQLLNLIIYDNNFMNFIKIHKTRPTCGNIFGCFFYFFYLPFTLPSLPCLKANISGCIHRELNVWVLLFVYCGLKSLWL